MPGALLNRAQIIGNLGAGTLPTQLHQQCSQTPCQPRSPDPKDCESGLDAEVSGTQSCRLYFCSLCFFA